MNDYEFDNQVISLMAALWPKRTGELNSEQTLIWRNALRRFKVGEVIIGFRTHAEHGKFFPAPCEVSKICRGNKPSDRAGPRNRIDHPAEDAQRHQIACEQADDEALLAGLSDEVILAHRDAIVQEYPFMDFIEKSPASNHWVRGQVADRIREGGTVDLLPDRGFTRNDACGGEVSDTPGQGLLDCAKQEGLP